jgi:hypothetical protein
LLLLTGITVRAQDSAQLKGLDVVPESLRARLFERLKLYVKYEHKGRYGKLYDLYSQTTFRKVPEGFTSTMQTKEVYTKFRKRIYPKLIGFAPQTILWKAGYYEIRGQARLRWKGGKSEDERLIHAYLENDDWYFSELLEEFNEPSGGAELVPVERIDNTGQPELHPVP